MRLYLLPGRGDNYQMFGYAKQLWKRRGYDTIVWRFDYERDDGDFDSRFARLMDHIDQQSYIVGCSAGGTVAVNALLSCKHVIRVATVASPLTHDRGRNKVLTASFNNMHRLLKVADRSLLSRLCSYAGKRDLMVPPAISKLEGAHYARLSGWSHNATIALAMTLNVNRIDTWLEQGQP